ncbi:putative tyrosinase protein [Phialemonium atrogriseum]|uniref:Tyrosinase protein n=1 Tax=Phialemonium atrogriseum TaxID=1093897 RepID=A0AAJ0FJF5_9PEZI|nr:putative tyrosinase protein [Phialemonium atrogriseum]KAK1764369.1 putative tyrosinase protein [Phialemonium atrogriseum]
MRLSLVSTAICGTLAVSALTIPQQSPVKRFELVDLKPFEDFTFELLSPEKAKAAAAADKSNVSPVAGLASAAQNGGVAGIMAGTCKSPKVRYEWRDLTDAHKKEFVNAVKCLLNKPSAGGSNYPGSKNRYEDLVSVHQQMTPTIHMVAQFLPWHRYYLSVYESMLRDECAYTGPMPWWDESKDAGKFSSAPMFTNAYFGSAPKKTADGKGTCVNDGAFKGITLHIGPGGSFTNHCLSRAVDESLTAQCNWDFVKSCNSHNTYSDMESCAEMGPHAYGHNGIGAVMSDVASSPGDPAFFLHHAFVDHNWRIWQNGNTSSRLYQINGFSTRDEPRKTLTLDYVLTSKGLRPDVTVRDVMDTMGGYLCYSYNY